MGRRLIMESQGCARLKRPNLQRACALRWCRWEWRDALDDVRQPGPGATRRRRKKRSSGRSACRLQVAGQRRCLRIRRPQGKASGTCFARSRAWPGVPAPGRACTGIGLEAIAANGLRGASRQANASRQPLRKLARARRRVTRLPGSPSPGRPAREMASCDRAGRPPAGGASARYCLAGPSGIPS